MQRELCAPGPTRSYGYPHPKPLLGVQAGRRWAKQRGKQRETKNLSKSQCLTMLACCFPLPEPQAVVKRQLPLDGEVLQDDQVLIQGRLYQYWSLEDRQRSFGVWRT